MTRASGKGLPDIVCERRFHLGRVVRGSEQEATAGRQAKGKAKVIQGGGLTYRFVRYPVARSRGFVILLERLPAFDGIPESSRSSTSTTKFWMVVRRQPIRTRSHSKLRHAVPNGNRP